MLMLDYAYSCTMIMTNESWLLEPYPFSAFAQIADSAPLPWRDVNSPAAAHNDLSVS
jgi:hypothetical protein